MKQSQNLRLGTDTELLLIFERDLRVSPGPAELLDPVE